MITDIPIDDTDEVCYSLESIGLEDCRLIIHKDSKFLEGSNFFLPFNKTFMEILTKDKKTGQYWITDKEYEVYHKLLTKEQFELLTSIPIA